MAFLNGLSGTFPAAFANMPDVMSAEPKQASRRGGGFLRGLRNRLGGGGDFMERVLMSQALLNGDYGAAMQMRARQQQAAAQQAEAEAQARAAEEQFLTQHQALAGLGMDKTAIAAMSPQQRSQMVMERLQPRQFGPEGGSLGIPGADGQMAYQQAPWQRQIGRSIIGGGPNGAAPQTIYEGVEPVSVPEGGSVYGMTGTGRIVSGAEPPAPVPPPGGRPDEATLRAQAEEAIRQGADPVQVRQRLEQMLRGGASPSNGSATFPRP